MDKTYKIGIYGGTFSPPHVGHIAAARAFVNEVGLDRLYVTVAGIPPHKRLASGDDPEMRLLMAKTAFACIPEAVVSDYEIRKGGVSYTADTLTHFKKSLTDEFSNSEIYFLCGTDMFLTLDSWRMPEVIFNCAIISCARREDDPALEIKIREKKRQYEEKYSARIKLLTSPAIEISSSELREMLAEGSGAENYLDPAVFDIIKREKLYIQKADRND